MSKTVKIKGVNVDAEKFSNLLGEYVIDCVGPWLEVGLVTRNERGQLVPTPLGEDLLASVPYIPSDPTPEPVPLPGKPCEPCNGTGEQACLTSMHKCDWCGGTGRVGVADCKDAKADKRPAFDSTVDKGAFFDVTVDGQRVRVGRIKIKDDEAWKSLTDGKVSGYSRTLDADQYAGIRIPVTVERLRTHDDLFDASTHFGALMKKARASLGGLVEAYGELVEGSIAGTHFDIELTDG